MRLRSLPDACRRGGGKSNDAVIRCQRTSPPQHWKWFLQSLPQLPWEVLLQPLPSSHHRWPAQHSSWRSLSTSSFCLVSAAKQKAAHHPCSTPLGLPTEERFVLPPSFQGQARSLREAWLSARPWLLGMEDDSLPGW